MARTKDERYGDKEAAARLIAALKGARVAESKPMKSMTPKRKKAQREKPKPGD